MMMIIMMMTTTKRRQQQQLEEEEEEEEEESSYDIFPTKRFIKLTSDVSNKRLGFDIKEKILWILLLPLNIFSLCSYIYILYFQC